MRQSRGPEHLATAILLVGKGDSQAAGAVVDRLARAQVHVSLRGDNLRLSPYVYNTEDDVRRLLDTLRAVL